MRAINSPVDRGTRDPAASERPRPPPRTPTLPGGAGCRAVSAFAHPVREIGRALSEDYGTVPVSVTRGVYKSLKTR
jgi:hypothetical protein